MKMKIKRKLFFSVWFLCLFILTSLSLPAQEIHVILAVDYAGSESSLLRNIIYDKENMKYFFQSNIPVEKLKLSVMDSFRLTPDAIREEIKKINAKSEDTIVFYYSGHGANDGFNGGHHFQLISDGKNVTITRNEILNAMIDKGTHLNILLSDCCNFYQSRTDVKEAKDIEKKVTRTGVATPEDFTPVIKKFFIEPDGVVDITSSAPEEGSYETPQGKGCIATVAWLQVWDKYNELFKKDPTAKKDWETFIEDVIPIQDKFFRELTKDHPVSQVTQTPYAYDLPGRPRFGAFAQTLGTGIGNVVITELLPDSAAEAAGLKKDDVITFLNNKEILDEKDYSKALDESPRDMKIRFKRNGKEFDTIAHLNGQPKRERINFARIGIIIEKLIVKEVIAEKPGEVAGLKENDVILKVNGTTIKETDDLVKEIDKIQKNDWIVEIVYERDKKASKPIKIFTGNYPKGTPIFGVHMRGNNNKIYKIIKNSPADRAGLKENYRILKFNSKLVKNGVEYGKYVEEACRKGIAEVKITAENADRESEEFTVIMNLTAAKEAEEAEIEKAKKIMFGANMKSDSCLITKIVPGSPAEKAGLKVKDTILKFNDKKIATGTEFSKEVDKANEARQARVQLWVRNGSTGVEEDYVVYMNLQEVKKETPKEEKPAQETTDAQENAPAAENAQENVSANDNAATSMEDGSNNMEEDQTSPLDGDSAETGSEEASIFGVSMNNQNNNIDKVVEGSPAERVGLKAGDRLLKINDVEIKTGSDMDKAIDASPQSAQIEYKIADGTRKKAVVKLNK